MEVGPHPAEAQQVNPYEAPASSAAVPRVFREPLEKDGVIQRMFRPIVEKSPISVMGPGAMSQQLIDRKRRSIWHEAASPHWRTSISIRRYPT